jgi:hypothetical protein
MSSIKQVLQISRIAWNLLFLCLFLSWFVHMKHLYYGEYIYSFLMTIVFCRLLLVDYYFHFMLSHF